MAIFKEMMGEKGFVQGEQVSERLTRLGSFQEEILNQRKV